MSFFSKTYSTNHVSLVLALTMLLVTALPAQPDEDPVPSPPGCFNMQPGDNPPDGTTDSQNDGTEGEKCPATVGDPLKVTRSSMHESVVDLVIPVKHGLQLQVRREFSSRYSYHKNVDGYSALGYSTKSNWHLNPYDALY